MISNIGDPGVCGDDAPEPVSIKPGELGLAEVAILGVAVLSSANVVVAGPTLTVAVYAPGIPLATGAGIVTVPAVLTVTLGAPDG